MKRYAFDLGYILLVATVLVCLEPQSMWSLRGLVAIIAIACIRVLGFYEGRRSE